ncbi:type III PLP-dependent enzyme [Lentibacter algarum]|uniref:type III PLP-dependent enzyme n=1 Tax=Lentibacter algarum TaxID=576131 RepID=UPI001C0757E1|nr:type III PLP-dependent enzyme [Lentibacter algarum]MBU2981959.1 type III PLP-dependent enzyme [Lentibacter algarum]
MFETSRYKTPQEHIRAQEPDVATLYFNPEVLQAQARRFVSGFDGLVTYAVKANAAPEVLENLVAAGIKGFDVASPEEIAQVRRAAPNAALHYNNPVRSKAEVAAGKAARVASWSVDEMSELQKLGPARTGEEAAEEVAEEVAVRFKLPVAGAHYDFGDKFGADEATAVDLLKAAAKLGYAPALSFHPGTQCDDASAWARYIEASAEIAGKAGVTLRRLNVGGGFASHRSGSAPDLEQVFDVIKETAERVFAGKVPALICEPGRAMVAECFTLGTRVKALRGDGSLFLNDGIYGGFAEWRDIFAVTRLTFVRPDGTLVGGKPTPRRAFGPTCDSLDVLPEALQCPADLQEGDYLLFEAMGAYTLAIATGFNGYGPREVITVGRG